MNLYGLAVFAAVYALAVASPGPGVAAVIARSLARGARHAPAFIAGFLVGDLIWFAVAAAGLAAIAETAQTLFMVVKYLGAAYLLYLAWKLWTAPVRAHAIAEASSDRPLSLFVGSLTLTLANPKTMVFFLALLPTVVELNRLTLAGYLEIAAVIALVLPLVLCVYVLLAARARRLFTSAGAIRRINRTTGAAMACAAAAVATR